MVTRTARIHAQAWKQVFDAFLARREPEARPFDAADEYRRYVDGKPRYDGVASFLKSRSISLPYGNTNDPSGEETICALGNKKNDVFRRLLADQGVHVYDDAVRLIREARRRGLKVAVISASKNCKHILDAADLTSLFDAIVGGTEAAASGLKGKPAPDIFLEAAKRLGAAPARVAVIEDALAGVAAGKAGGFALVIGVDRSGTGEALIQSGANIVVGNLNDLDSAEGDRRAKPVSAMDALDEIKQMIGARPAAFFLDYDGTLTPIVDRPEHALLSNEMREILMELADLTSVSIISGRSVENVRRLVGLEELVYAGAHGFDIFAAHKEGVARQFADDYVPIVAEAEHELLKTLKSVAGALVEGKKYAVAVHYRLVAQRDVARVRQAVEAVAERHPQLKLTKGKKVYELRPNIEWDKGKAVQWIYDALDLARSSALPIYIGDDTTDYDAFEALKDNGIGILVSEEPLQTAARYYLRDVGDVARFLRAMIDVLRSRPS